ncbi:sigma factor G inhibitor Gin [Alkalihalobacterium alkalinitrilicum]|uniref:sigma factor G inhibitor Gin n=1 Tax=Alkalihalobacterium alkalinitrilicum TaxID=427920 RepID=UPI0023683562|nr:sigma factor G inhibitor Gin [Alkalihalobacterium alkalinitrilicum]
MIVIDNVKLLNQGQKHCVICEQEKSEGIHLFEYFICEKCERQIVITEPNDVYYHYYLKKMKKIKLPTIN